MKNFEELTKLEKTEIYGGGSRFWKILGALCLGFAIGFIVESLDSNL